MREWLGGVLVPMLAACGPSGADDPARESQGAETQSGTVSFPARDVARIHARMMAALAPDGAFDPPGA